MIVEALLYTGSLRDASLNTSYEATFRNATQIEIEIYNTLDQIVTVQVYGYMHITGAPIGSSFTVPATSGTVTKVLTRESTSIPGIVYVSYQAAGVPTTGTLVILANADIKED